MRIQRLFDGSIISADLHPSIGSNIQGPSMIRAPDWIEGRLGNYYLYFADHKGRYILHARLSARWHDVRHGHARAVLSLEGRHAPVRTRSDFIQSNDAAFGGDEAWRRAMGVLDPGLRGARTNSAEPNRPRRRLA
jgi:hypothetical protein